MNLMKFCLKHIKSLKIKLFWMLYLPPYCCLIKSYIIIANKISNLRPVLSLTFCSCYPIFLLKYSCFCAYLGNQFVRITWSTFNPTYNKTVIQALQYNIANVLWYRLWLIWLKNFCESIRKIIDSGKLRYWDIMKLLRQWKILGRFCLNNPNE